MIFAQITAANSQHFIGNGGEGKSITINRPHAEGLEQAQNLLPDVAQGVLTSIFSTYSAIRVSNIVTIHETIPTEFSMDGRIVKFGAGYNLELKITRNADRMVAAAFSGNTTLEELNNHIALRRAALFLLERIGVTLTANAQQELAGAAPTNHIGAQTHNARAVVAQRQGRETEAMANFNMAAILDPSLTEATNRLSILETNIRSGSIGDDARNEIAWRRAWVERLRETEQFFADFHRREAMPYTLFYGIEITQGNIVWEREVIDNMSIQTHLHGSCIWTLSIERALQAVFDGLRATGRAQAWQLAGWPRQPVTNLNAFGRRNSDFHVAFELLNDQNKVIGRQTLRTGGFWELSWSGDRPTIRVNASNRQTLGFQNVSVNDLPSGDGAMSIRVVTVNGIPAETAARDGVLQIRAVNKAFFDGNDMFRFSRGEILGFARRDNRPRNLIIPDNIWGDPVIIIGNEAFLNNNLRVINIPASVTTIGERAFFNDRQHTAGIRMITIGANVNIAQNSFGHENLVKFSDGSSRVIIDNSFVVFYQRNNSRAGEYQHIHDSGWHLDASVEDIEDILRKFRRKDNAKFVFAAIGIVALIVVALVLPTSGE